MNMYGFKVAVSAALRVKGSFDGCAEGGAVV